MLQFKYYLNYIIINNMLVDNTKNKNKILIVFQLINMDD